MGDRIIEKGATVLFSDTQEAIRVKASGRRRDPSVDWNTRPTDRLGACVFGQMVQKVADRGQADALANG